MAVSLGICEAPIQPRKILKPFQAFEKIETYFGQRNSLTCLHIKMASQMKNQPCQGYCIRFLKIEDEAKYIVYLLLFDKEHKKAKVSLRKQHIIKLSYLF